MIGVRIENAWDGCQHEYVPIHSRSFHDGSSRMYDPTSYRGLRCIYCGQQAPDDRQPERGEPQ